MKQVSLAFAGLAFGLVTSAPAMAIEFNPGVQTRYDSSGRAVEGPTVSKRHGRIYRRIPRETVSYDSKFRAGTIIVNTKQRRLYYILSAGRALKYAIGVGRPGFQWSGTHRITRKAEWPGWTPPPQMRKRQPGLPRYMPGGPNNPLGARAMYIGSTIYRIHGSNEPWTMGRAVSSGCIRMTNEDVKHLYRQVKVGTRVVVKH